MCFSEGFHIKIPAFTSYGICEMRMQGIVLLGGFLKLTPYATDSQMTDDQVYEGVEKALRKYFGKRGEQVVQDNLTCVKRGYSEMQEISPEMNNA